MCGLEGTDQGGGDALCLASSFAEEPTPQAAKTPSHPSGRLAGHLLPNQKRGIHHRLLLHLETPASLLAFDSSTNRS